MAYDGLLTLNGVEIINFARTATLAETFGITPVWTDSEEAKFAQGIYDDPEYDNVGTAPWYSGATPASAEFAGVIPIRIEGLEDSTYSRSPVEYIGNGGHPGRGRSSTLPIVVTASLVGTTERGVEYGLRWLESMLRGDQRKPNITGRTIQYLSEGSSGWPALRHRNLVALTRGVSVTRKYMRNCSVVWSVSFTLTASDPHEYSDPIWLAEGLGGTAPTFSPLVTSVFPRQVDISADGYMPYMYEPFYDPYTPGLLPPPQSPAGPPMGWEPPNPGDKFVRYAFRVDDMIEGELPFVPLIQFSTPHSNFRNGARVSVWPVEDYLPNALYGNNIWNCTASIIPGSAPMLTVDGEREASYLSPNNVFDLLRPADSVVHGDGGGPVEWGPIHAPNGFIVALDVFNPSWDPAYVPPVGDAAVRVGIVRRTG